MKVKICGIKKIEDALEAINYGADALGFLVGQKHNSVDFIDKDHAKNMVENLPPFYSSVLVTHLTDNEEIIYLASYIGVTTIQFHGDSSPEDIVYVKQRLPYIKVIKSVHVKNEKSIEEIQNYLKSADAILLDSINITTDQVGGTGMTHDWNISKLIVDMYKIPIILAGGLNPSNVKEAINKVSPYGVDVNSGVKGLDGFKDCEKLKSFIYNAKVI